MIERRCAEVAWVHFVPNDFIADALHYGFGDVRKMTGPEALLIAYRLKNYFTYDNDGNPKSSVVIALRAILKTAQEEVVELSDEEFTYEDEGEEVTGRVASSEQLAHMSSWSSLDVYDTPIGEFVSLKE